MDTIRYLLGAIIKLAVGLLLISFVLWLVGILYPELKPSKIFNVGVFTRDWLPAPKNYGGLLGNRTNSSENGKVYVPGPAYNGYANQNTYQDTGDVEWVIYTSTGTQIIGGRQPSNQNANNQVFTGNTSAYAQKSLYVRNLSLYEGGNISYGQTFVGEARDTMFRNGIFTIIILDKDNKVINTTQAINTGTWAAPGWARFQATIPSRLPSGTLCSLVFMSSQTNTQVRMNVRCN